MILLLLSSWIWSNSKASGIVSFFFSNPFSLLCQSALLFLTIFSFSCKYLLLFTIERFCNLFVVFRNFFGVFLKRVILLISLTYNWTSNFTWWKKFDMSIVFFSNRVILWMLLLYLALLLPISMFKFLLSCCYSIFLFMFSAFCFLLFASILLRSFPSI